MKKFIINLVFYICAFFLCVYMSGHIEDMLHNIKCGETGYYITGQYAVIDLNVFNCDFPKHSCIERLK